MALPGLINGVEPEAQSHVPVYCDSNGNLYRITEEFAAPVEPHNTPRMMKSTDGGSTWAEVDQANRPPASDLEGTWALQVGTAVWWLHTNGKFLSFSIFNTSDASSNPDKWVVRDERPITGLTAGSQQWASLARTSDGKAWAFFSDTLSGTNKQLAYARRTGTNTWTAKTRLTGNTDSWCGAALVVGKNDVTHVVYHDYANRRVYWRTLSAAGVLSAATRLDTSGTNTATRNYNAACNPVYYDASGNEVITVVFAAASGLKAVTITNGVPGAEEAVSTHNPKISPPNGVDGNTGNDGPVMHLAVDGTTVHLIYSENANGKLWHAKREHGGPWSTPTVLFDPPTGEYIAWTYCNVFTRAGQRRLGYTYDRAPHPDNGSNIYFDEVVLGSTGGSGPDFTEGFESGSNGAAMSTSNTGFNGVDAGWTFAASPTPAEGSLSAHLDIPANVTRMLAHAISPVTDPHFRRFYLYLPSYPASANGISYAKVGGAVSASLRVAATGALQLRDNSASGSATVWTSTVLPTGQWIRVEWKLDAANQKQQVRLFSGTNVHGTTPDQDSGLQLWTAGAGGPSEITLGCSNGATAWALNVDAVADGHTDWLGPRKV